MIKIKDIYTGEIFKCNVSKEFATKDSFCTEFITNRWFQIWGALIEYRIPLSAQGNKRSYQIILKDRFEVVL